MINPIRNQKGIALIATLMLLVLGFAIVAILFRLSTQETKLARLEQGYTAALDAAKAGSDVFIDMVQYGLSTPPQPNQPYTGPPNPFGTPSNTSCFQLKMSNSPPWAAPCQANAATTDPTASPDITIALSNYTVNVKVIDNRVTDPVACTPPCPCQNGCHYYTVAVRAQATGGVEHADILFVYRSDQ